MTLVERETRKLKTQYLSGRAGGVRGLFGDRVLHLWWSRSPCCALRCSCHLRLGYPLDFSASSPHPCFRSLPTMSTGSHVTRPRFTYCAGAVRTPSNSVERKAGLTVVHDTCAAVPQWGEVWVERCVYTFILVADAWHSFRWRMYFPR